MSNKEHDKLVFRLSTMLKKLNDGEKLDPAALAAEFNVSLRTIQRDINERLSICLDLQKEDGCYSVEPGYFGKKLSYRDIQQFAALAGVQKLFPVLDAQFLRELLDLRLQKTLLVHGHHHEDAGPHLELFRQLQQAIQERRCISFQYHKAAETKSVWACPCKLVNHLGVWYAASVDRDDEDRPKAYALGRITDLQILEQIYEVPPKVLAMLEEEDSIWLNHEKTEAVLKIDASVAYYFRRRQLIAGQQIVKTLDDGGLLISGKFAHPNQIVPIVRYWLPRVRIVSPEEWQTELERELRDYLDG